MDTSIYHPAAIIPKQISDLQQPKVVTPKVNAYIIILIIVLIGLLMLSLSVYKLDNSNRIMFNIKTV